MCVIIQLFVRLHDCMIPNKGPCDPNRTLLKQIVIVSSSHAGQSVGQNLKIKLFSKHNTRTNVHVAF